MVTAATRPQGRAVWAIRTSPRGHRGATVGIVGHKARARARCDLLSRILVRRRGRKINGAKRISSGRRLSSDLTAARRLLASAFRIDAQTRRAVRRDRDIRRTPSNGDAGEDFSGHARRLGFAIA